MPPEDDLGFTPEKKTPAADDGLSSLKVKDDLGFVPETHATAGASAKSQESDLGFVPETKPNKEEIYGGGLQQAIAGVEGAAKGLAGPLATLAETKILGVNPEDIAGREEANPWTHGIAEAGALGVSSIYGVGEAALLAKAGEAIAGASKLGKIGSQALKLGVEGGLFHLGDNTSQMILGKTDPEAPVASFLAGLPEAVVLGGGLGYLGGKAGTKLQEMANSETASKASKFLSDFGNKFDFLSKNKDVPMAATEEAQHLFDTVSAATADGFSLKRDSIEKLTKDIDPSKAAAYVNDLRAKFSSVPRSMQNNELFQDAVQKWEARVSPKMDIAGGKTYSPEPADIFEATDDLKRSMQHWASFEKRITNPSELPFVRSAAAISGDIRASLENPEHWGEMGKFQKELNGAYSKIQAPLKDFISAAMSKKEGVHEVDPAKIASVFRSVSKEKPLAGFKSDKIADFFKPARDLLETIDSLHASQGIESGIPKVSTNVLDEALRKEISHGSKAAEWFFGAGPGAIGWAGGHAVGTAVGAAAGHPYLGYRAGEHVAPILREMGRRPTKWAAAALLRSLSSGSADSVPQAMHYAEGIHRGAQRIDNSINNIFKIGGKQYLESDHSEESSEKLKKFVEDGSLNQQIQNMSQQAKPVTGEDTKGFAHGGEVIAAEQPMPVAKPVGRAVPKKDHIASVFPEQSMILGAAKSRVNNYLNQIRPQTAQQKMAFDEHMPDKEKEKSYNRALKIANKPLSVLDHVKNGTLEPEHMQHLNQLYPEMTNHLQKKIGEKIAKDQINNQKPPYRVRQALSLFMGSALDSNLTPQNIMAAQATFIKGQSPQGGMIPRTQKNVDQLDKSVDQYRTSQQSLQVRQSRSKP